VPVLAGRTSWHRSPANAAATLLGLAYPSASLVVAIRQRHPSVNVIAWLALVGALLVGEPLAGAVIAVMLATGALGPWTG
jgi:hypothetical protein